MADAVVDLTTKAYDLVRLIPYGKVTTYGHIAKLAGYPNYSRHVGQAMKMLPSTTDIPWQRVISSKGTISPRGDGGSGAERQKQRLQAEGVEVVTLTGGGGEKIDFRVYGWFPEEIPHNQD